MKEVSILIGGEAGEGIKFGAELLSEILNDMGYKVFAYIDYPSLIRGGHNFAVIRASEKKVFSHRDKVDFILALNQDTIERHKNELKENGYIIFDSSRAKEEGLRRLGIPAVQIVRELKLPLTVRNTVLIGAFSSIAGIPFEVAENALKRKVSKNVEENVAALRKAYEYAQENCKEKTKIEKVGERYGEVITGNESTARGLVDGGLEMYIAYPMTPASPILHYLAANQDKFGIKVVHPENEIAVINMALGSSYAGKRTAVGTSGGGFALMTEALSLAGMSETPIMIIEAQRAGPSTGTPTYTMQGDLLFVLFAGHGEFPRIVIAPGDAEEAYWTAGFGINLAWKFQVPVIFLTDKHLGESLYTAKLEKNMIKRLEPKIWDGSGEYKRYKLTEDGISPLAFPGNPNAIVKATSYEHDEFGITTEEPEIIEKMQEKRRRKRDTIVEFLKDEKTVNVGGNPDSDVVLITWGSTKGVVFEVAEELGLKAVQPIYLEPFPEWEVKKHLKNAKKIIDVEVNSTGLFSKLLNMYGIDVHEKILKYNARPFTFDELLRKVKEVI